MVLEEERDEALDEDGVFSQMPEERCLDTIIVVPQPMEEETIRVTYHTNPQRSFVGFREEKAKREFELLPRGFSGDQMRQEPVYNQESGQKKLKGAQNKKASYHFIPGKPEPDALLGIETEPLKQSQGLDSPMKEETGTQSHLTNPEEYDDWDEDLEGTIVANPKVISVKNVPKIVAKPKNFERVFTFSDQQSADNFVNRKNYKRRFKSNYTPKPRNPKHQVVYDEEGNEYSEEVEENGDGQSQRERTNSEELGTGNGREMIEEQKTQSKDQQMRKSEGINQKERNQMMQENGANPRKFSGQWDKNNQKAPEKNSSFGGNGRNGGTYNGYGKYSNTGKKPVAAPNENSNSKYNPKRNCSSEAKCGWSLPFMNGGAQRPNERSRKPAAGEAGNSQSTLNAFLMKK